MTFFKNLQSNSLPTGKSFQSNPTKFPHPRLHIAVNPKAERKKGTIKISQLKIENSTFKVLELRRELGDSIGRFVENHYAPINVMPAGEGEAGHRVGI